MKHKLLSLLSLVLIVSACSYAKANPKKRFTITWKNWDGSVLEIDKNVAYGSTPSYDSAAPTRPDDSEYAYTWNGWSPEIVPAVADQTYIASYSYKQIEILSYKIDFTTFDLGSGTTLQSSDPTFKTKVVDFLSTNTESFVSDIDYTKENKVKIQKDTFPKGFDSVKALLLASQNDDGYLSMTFTKKLVSVTVCAQQYYNIVAGYGGDKHNYPNYDCQLYNQTTGEYIGDPNAGLFVNDKKMPIKCISYEYDNEGYPIVNIPEICKETIKINSTTLKLEALASYRMRVYDLTLNFAK